MKKLNECTKVPRVFGMFLQDSIPPKKIGNCWAKRIIGKLYFLIS